MSGLIGPFAITAEFLAYCEGCFHEAGEESFDFLVIVQFFMINLTDKRTKAAKRLLSMPCDTKNELIFEQKVNIKRVF
ncbi:hypothetical protein KP788_03705 [Streptococcus equi subsp. equi]|uniref:hypothetical protein n=1 Tax=Streptococcus equi TaxID=1336 RepID=UPI001E3F3102|nr:hypothetical protein [Streptococcus equi]MCD3497907.1 hypothetical protein [Streptococcus equi subsp. equi]